MNAGQVARMLNRETGSLMGVYRAEEAGLDTLGGPWVAVCEDHGSIVNVQTARRAHEAARDPRSFCEGCRDSMPNRMVNDIARTLEDAGFAVEVSTTEVGRPFWGIVGERNADNLNWAGIHVMVHRNKFLGGRAFGILRDRKIRTWDDFRTEVSILGRAEA